MNERTAPRNATLQALTTSYSVFAEGRPLAIGIHKAIQARQPELDGRALRLALRLHTSSTRYLKAVANGSQRFDLEGNPAGEITAEQKAQALDALKERFRVGAERKREAERARLEAEKTAHQRQKLEQLAAKFNAR